MIITNLETNHLPNPLGFAFDPPVFSWKVEATADKKQRAARVLVASDVAFSQILFDSGQVAGQTIDSLAYRPPLPLTPRTRYYWKVQVWGETESAESEIAWFETGKLDEPWRARWITPNFANTDTHPLIFREFELPSRVRSARAYVCGLGLYHFELNGEKVGEEFLTPYCNAYDQWLQYQTFDITRYLHQGANQIAIMLGNGWYKGRYGLQDPPHQPTAYGDHFALICELHCELESGARLVIVSDRKWKARPAPVLKSDIYDGESYDARIANLSVDVGNAFGVRQLALDSGKLQARRSPPVCIQEEIQPIAFLHTPSGETVLDMGQNMVGWVRFTTRAAAGTRIHLQFGEVLQDGNFYRENLRSARAEYIYIADGRQSIAQPYFCFFGFRYVRVMGWEGELSLDDFTGCVLYSKMTPTGTVETSNPQVNQLFRNVLWSQKGNFVDIPTDCPQRDERLGWTGDAQMFCGTACFNMDSSAFYAKYAYDLALEQAKHDGKVPDVIPAANTAYGGSSAWGDAATILPWTLYEFFGDRTILEQQFASMRAWVDHIRKMEEAAGSRRLWSSGYHWGDWLALDGSDPNEPRGGTPEDFIASAFYYYSTRLVARAADVLGKADEADHYTALAEEILAAIQQEFFTPGGRLAIHTQTGYVLALFMNLAPDAFRRRLIGDLLSRMRKDHSRLRTGFVGTPYLCRVLSNHGANDLAYQLLLNEDDPSWLYAVKRGATTIWERWDALKADGSLHPPAMNSFNHYAYGSIVEWIYRDLCGLNPTARGPGFRRARLAPKPDQALKWARASYQSASGLYESGWQIGEQGSLIFDFRIPFNADAEVVLPDANVGEIRINGQPCGSGAQHGSEAILQLDAGGYHIEYPPSRPYRPTLSSHIPAIKILENKQAKKELRKFIPMVAALTQSMIAAIGDASLRELAQTPYLNLSDAEMDQIDQMLRQFPLGDEQS